MSIKLKIEGFEQLLNDIEKANGSIMDATKKCMKKSADIMQDELKAKMQSANVPNDLISRMPAPLLGFSANSVIAKVGYDKGAYNPENPSDGYKVVFLNYGTPNRTKHGKMRKLGFIQKAKNSAKKKIYAEQEKTLTEILKGLTK